MNNPKDKSERINYYAEIYEQIEAEYNAHLNDRNIIDALADFDRKVPHGVNLTKIKKIDFMLWSNRSDRTVSILEYNKLLDDLDDLRNQLNELSKNI